MTAPEFPPLPEPPSHPAWDYAGATEVVSVHDAKAYARECARLAVLAQGERYAKLCDAMAEGWKRNPKTDGCGGYIAASNCALEIRRDAAAIRSQGEVKA